MWRVVTVLVLGAVAAFSAAVDGKWSATYETQAGSITTTWELKADGDKLTGKASSSFGDRPISEGKIEGNQISWVENIDAGGMPIRVVTKGTLSGDEMKLTRVVGDAGTTETTAKRVK